MKSFLFNDLEENGFGGACYTKFRLWFNKHFIISASDGPWALFKWWVQCVECEWINVHIAHVVINDNLVPFIGIYSFLVYSVRRDALMDGIILGFSNKEIKQKCYKRESYSK